MPQEPYADSLESGQPHQLFAVDADGRVLGRKERRRRAFGYFGLLSSLLGLGLYTSAQLDGAPGWFLAGAMGALVFWRVDLSLRFERGARAAARSRILEADRVFTGIARRRFLPVGRRAQAYDWLSQCASLRGDAELALAHTRAALRHHGRSAPASIRLTRMSEVLLLARLGRVQEARRFFAAISEEPEGEVLRLRFYFVEAYLAFKEGKHSLSESVLHDRAKFALQVTAAAPLLLALGWAFAQVGDEDMAQLLVDEAMDRPHDTLEKTVPDLLDWAESRRPVEASEVSAVRVADPSVRVAERALERREDEALEPRRALSERARG